MANSAAPTQPAAARRAALAATRSLEILSYLAAHPAQGHTLTELARELEVNPSSMHGILSVMTESGYLVRHPTHKTYRLGPVVAAVGQAAAEQNVAIELARAELRNLSSDYDLQTAVVTVIDGDMVVVGRDGPPTGRLVSFVGQRIRHAPPFGSVFSAWGSDGAVDDWLDAASPPLDRARRADYSGLLDVVREEQRAILVVVDREFRFAVAPKRVPKGSELLVPLSRRGGQRVFYVGVPIFDAAGVVSLAMFIDGPTTTMRPETVEDIAERLGDAARKVMAPTGGSAPSG
jgi:DNA-binding IclR family transcriptional regulator